VSFNWQEVLRVLVGLGALVLLVIGVAWTLAAPLVDAQRGTKWRTRLAFGILIFGFLSILTYIGFTS
jgi:glucose uptake protein GlcU